MCESCLQENHAVKSLLLWFLGMAKPGFIEFINSIAEHLNIL